MVIYGSSTGFHGDSMVIYGSLTGFNGDLMVILWRFDGDFVGSGWGVDDGNH